MFSYINSKFVNFYTVVLILLTIVAVINPLSSSGISKSALVGIIVGGIAGSVILSAVVALIISRKRTQIVSKQRHCEYIIQIS